MGRRKKAPAGTHREAITAAARALFAQRGIEAVTMNDIARVAGYSKATLYVYFHNKEELVSLLALESMEKLAAYLDAALVAPGDTHLRYRLICRGLLRYQTEFPDYFKLALEELDPAPGAADCLPGEREADRVGEEINGKLKRFLREGVAAGALRGDLEELPTIFSFWGMLSGLIQTAASKETYLRQGPGLSKEAFLTYGFEMLYRAVAAQEGTR